MPKDKLKRGRRGEQKKRKLDHNEGAPDTKRLKPASEEPDYVALPEEDQQQDESIERPSHALDTPFYGLLDEEEQEYFKKADEMLELNQFSDADERRMFLANVWKEADGKELKIANSQSCSRLMERLIMLSTPAQLKTLFQKLSGQFLYLVQHRFASHCCETLFIQSASVVSLELTEPASYDQSTPNDEIVVSMENLFLHTLNELEGSVGYLMTDPFASHTLRVLLVVLSGESLPSLKDRSVVRSKRKDKVRVPILEDGKEFSLEKREVPESFSQALEKLIQESVSGLDTTTLRTLSTHPTGNPTLQLLLQFELSHYGKQRAKDENSILRKLLPDDSLSEDSDSAKFINGLVYDTIGSRLLETIVQYSPAKLFKGIYKQLFKDRIGSLARNEVAGYVVAKILERLGKDDLQEAVKLIVPQISGLVERNRISVIRTLIDRCAARDVDTSAIASELEAAYSGPNGFDIARLLKLGEPTPEQGDKIQPSATSSAAAPEKAHGSLLAQAMIAADGSLGSLVYEALIRLGASLSVKVAKDPFATRTIQAALTSSNATIIFRRKMIQQFYGHVGELALDPSASHVIDAIWEGTLGLAFIRERVAEELAENEASLRDSFSGRAVWRNWKMDLYKRRRPEWVLESKSTAGNDRFLGFPEPKGSTKKGNKHRSAIELAREKHAASKAKKESKGHGKDKKSPVTEIAA